MDFLFIKHKDKLSPDKLSEIKNFSQSIWEEIEIFEIENVIFIFPKRFMEKCFVQNKNFVGFISGFVRDYNLSSSANLSEHNESFLNELLNENFPLKENWTGSFASLAYDLSKQNILICNDVIGFYSLYYSIEKDLVIVSSNLILLNKVFRKEIDATGLLQSLIPQKYANFGRRTLLKNVYRLLPGELVKINSDNSIKREFDTTLFGKCEEGNPKVIAKDIWKIIKEDIDLILTYESEVNLAMSGGIDSRLILGAIPSGKKIDCLTIGDYDFNETQIAEKCAKVRKTEFKYFPSDDFLFPDFDILKKYSLSTESTGDNEWLAISESTKNSSNKFLLLGDMCESIRSITNNTFIVPRSTRIKNYLKNIFGKGYEFTIATNDMVVEWEKRKIQDNLPPLNLLKSFNIQYDIEEIKSDYECDLKIMFELIRKIDPKFIEQYDLLFYWFTNARQTTARQTLLMRNKFFAISPITSMKIIRSASNIHPKHLLFDKIVNEIFKLNEMKDLAKIPTTQIPFVRYSSNGFLKYIVWYYRAKMDKHYINRIMKKKNPNLRYRVCNATNYPLIYHHKDAEKNIKSWFSNKFFSGEKYINLFLSRKNLEKKTTFNQDLVIPASVSIMLDEIKS